MARPSKVPAAPKQHATGQSYNKWKGKTYYHGKWGSEDAWENFLEFQRRCRESLAQEKSVDQIARAELSVAEASILFLDWAAGYYSLDHRGYNREAKGIEVILRRLIATHGDVYLKAFGPADILQFREGLIAEDLSRGYINDSINKIKRLFRWCVEQQYVEPSVLLGLQAVAPLRKGKSKAREKAKPQPVPLETVEKTLPFLNRIHQSIVLFQLYCGLRPAETLTLRPMDLDRSETAWLYLPESHKNSWRDQHLIKAVPQIAQDAIRGLLDRKDDSLVFDTRESYRGYSRRLPGHVPTRPKGRFDTTQYGTAISRGIERGRKAGIEIEHWSPNQLRHTIATFLSERIGVEGASLWLGHADLDTTGIYRARQKSELRSLSPIVDGLIRTHFPPGITRTLETPGNEPGLDTGSQE